MLNTQISIYINVSLLQWSLSSRPERLKYYISMKAAKRDRTPQRRPPRGHDAQGTHEAMEEGRENGILKAYAIWCLQRRFAVARGDSDRRQAHMHTPSMLAHLSQLTAIHQNICPLTKTNNQTSKQSNKKPPTPLYNRDDRSFNKYTHIYITISMQQLLRGD